MANHSTETALIKVKNDIMNALDSNQVTLLVLLDLSAAFDTIDRDILVSRLSSRVGVRDIALDWFKSYLADWSASVSMAVKPQILLSSALGCAGLCIWTTRLLCMHTAGRRYMYSSLP